MSAQEDITAALQSIRPGAQWSLNGSTYADLVWMDGSQTQPTAPEVSSAITAVQASVAAEAQRQASIKADAQRIAMLNRLKASTNAQIDAYVSANVTNLAQAQAAIGIILKLIALDARN